MSIGTSLGAYFETEAEMHLAPYNDNDNNTLPPEVLNPDSGNDNNVMPPHVHGPAVTEVGDKMPFPDNRNPDTDFTSRFGNLPPSGILNDLKKPNDPSPPLIRRISDVQPTPDYDYASWARANPDAKMEPGQHYPDTYKLPNHMTFSDESMYNGKDGNEGGHWQKLEGDPDHDWSFTPGKTNMQNHSPDEMKDYFNRVEPRSILNLSNPNN